MNIKEKAKDLFLASAEQSADIVSSLFLEGVVGSVIPGVSGAMLAYKQKRQERIYCAFMEEVQAKMGVMEKRLERLSQDALIAFKDKYFGMISDYVLEEVQEKKVKYLANGLVNLAGMEDANEDFLLTYYDTLRDLRIIDIVILRRKYDFNYHITPLESYNVFLQKAGLEDQQYKLVSEKLKRAGLLITKREKSKNQDDLYKNVEKMQNYLTSLEKYLDATEKGRKVRLPKLPTLKEVDQQESFEISKFGRDFVQFFTE